MIDGSTGLRIPSFWQGVCFDPGTLALVAVAGSLAGGAVQAVGAIQQGQAQAAAATQQSEANAAAAKYNADVADANANLVRMNAAAVRQQTSQDVVAQARTQAKQLGAVRAGYGASGLDFSGTALDVFEDQALDANYDLHLTQYKGNLRAVDYEQQALGFGQSATLDRMQADADVEAGKLAASSAKSASYIGAASALIGGGTSAASTRLRLSGQGL